MIMFGMVAGSIAQSPEYFEWMWRSNINLYLPRRTSVDQLIGVTQRDGIHTYQPEAFNEAFVSFAVSDNCEVGAYLRRTI